LKYYVLRSSHANVARRALRTPDFVRRISLPFLLFCSVYACKYTHTRVCTHTHRRTHAHKHSHSYTHTRTRTHVHAHMHTRTHTCMRSCYYHAHASTGTYRKCISCLHVHLRNVYSFYICTCTRIYIHTYVYMHAYI